MPLKTFRKGLVTALNSKIQSISMSLKKCSLVSYKGKKTILFKTSAFYDFIL